MTCDLMFRLHRALAPHLMDGSEGHAIIEELVKMVIEADGDIVRIRSAALDAKTRVRALIVDHVSVDAAINAVANVIEIGELP